MVVAPKLKKKVEQNCNILLEVIEHEPRIGAKEILSIAKRHKDFTLSRESYVGKYLSGLTNHGYIKKLGVYRPVYERNGTKKFKYPEKGTFIKW